MTEKQGRLQINFNNLINFGLMSEDSEIICVTSSIQDLIDIYKQLLDEARADFPTVQSEDLHGCNDETVNQTLSLNRELWFVKWFGSSK